MKIALELDAEKLGGKSDDPKTAEMALRVARRVHELALHKGVELKSTKDIQRFLYGHMEKVLQPDGTTKKVKKSGKIELVLPLNRNALSKAENERQQDIMRAMNPAKYKDKATMYAVAAQLANTIETIEDKLREQMKGMQGMMYQSNFMDEVQLNQQLRPEIDSLVEAHEQTRGFKSDSVPDVPKPPKGGGNGPGVGPTGTAAQPRSRPQAPRLPKAPNPAGAKLSLAEITALLPRVHRKHAAAVKAVMDRTPQLYLRNPASRKATIRALAANAHQRRLGAKSKPVGHQAALLKARKADAERARLRRRRALQEHHHRLRIIQRQRRLRKSVIPL